MSAIGEASTSEITAGASHKGVGTEEARVDGAPAIEAMNVNNTGQV